MKYTIEPMGLGDILSRGISLMVSRFGVFFAIEMIVAAPGLALQLLAPDVGAGLGMLLTAILGVIGSAAILHVIACEYLDQPVSLGGAFKFALDRFLPLLGTSILAGLGIVLGFLLCVIPGVYFAIVWAFAAQVVVMENVSGSAALGRSKSLVQGYFWWVFGVLLVVGLLVLIPAGVINGGLAVALPFQEIQANPNQPFAAPRVVNFSNFAINTVVSTMLGGIFQAFEAVCATLLYFDLRNRKEAFDVSHIVRWMDQYRDWREEPAADVPMAPGAAPETGIKPSGDVMLPPATPETGIQDPNAPRDNPPPPLNPAP